MIFDILKQLADTTSRNEKTAILERNKDNELLKRVFRMAYHPRIQYWIKKVPPTTDLQMDEYTLVDFLDLLEDEIAPRNTTGNAAIKLVGISLSYLSPEDKSVAIRVLKRDLEVGCSESTANEVWEDLIPVQPQLLATSYSEKALKNIKYPAYAQLKADGARCFAEVRGDSIDDVMLLSRGANEYLDLDKVKQELIVMTREARAIHPNGVMVDGELVSHETIQEVNKEAAEIAGLDFLLGYGNKEHDEIVENAVSRSKSNGIANKALKGTISPEEAETMKFQVWDIVPLDCIYTKKNAPKSSPYKDRYNLLVHLVNTSNVTRIEVIENHIVNNIDEAKAIYKEYVLQGLEGIILKNMDFVWENKRSKHQVKFKEEVNVDLMIVEALPHKKDGAKLGALSCTTRDGLVKVNVGSGFTDTTQVKVKGEWIPVPIEDRGELDRELLWLNKDSLPNLVIEVVCNGWIAKKGRKDHLSLFLPIIKGFRYDKKEANTLYEAFPDCNFEFGE